MSVRVKLALSYAGFLMIGGVLLLTAVWWFLLRNLPASVLAPRLSSLLLALDPSNFGPITFVPAAFTVLAFLLVFGLSGGWVIAGRMLAPLDRITHATRIAARGSFSNRIRLEGRRDEFRQLADAFDAMLEQLEAHLTEQQRFAANASHELRTPLAITQTLLDVARTDPHRDTAQVLDRLHVVNSRAIDLTEALLLLSRANQRGFTRDCVDLSLVAEEAVETLLPLAEKRGVAITVSGDIATTMGSASLLLQLTTNLVHNAIVHNVAEQGVVRVSTSLRSATAVITIENTGETISPRLASTLHEPFQRGTERVRTDQAGVGLGLAIVDTITDAHDGTLTLTPRPGGGLVVTVELPGILTARQGAED